MQVIVKIAKEENVTLLMQQALNRIQGLDIPDPPSELEFLGIRVHEVDGPRRERLLLAFGRIPLIRWLDVVNAYSVSFGEKPPYDAESDDDLVRALNRLHYERVAYKAAGSGFRILWDTEGLVPVTVWVVAERGV